MANLEIPTAREKETTAMTTRRAAPTDQTKRVHPLPNAADLGVRATTPPVDTTVMDGSMGGIIDTATAPATKIRNPDPRVLAAVTASATTIAALRAHEAATATAMATAIRDLYPRHPRRCGRATPPSQASRIVSP